VLLLLLVTTGGGGDWTGEGTCKTGSSWKDATGQREFATGISSLRHLYRRYYYYYYYYHYCCYYFYCNYYRTGFVLAKPNASFSVSSRRFSLFSWSRLCISLSLPSSNFRGGMVVPSKDDDTSVEGGVDRWGARSTTRLHGITRKERAYRGYFKI